MVFGPAHLQKMQEGLERFNRQHYWECHESLEEIWLEDRTDPVRNVYWAIIQVAASMVHFREQNLVGATGMLNKSREKFKRCRDLGVVSPLLETSLSWSHLEGLVTAVPSEPTELAPFQAIFDFRFPAESVA
jgi:uncharacterized protein